MCLLLEVLGERDSPLHPMKLKGEGWEMMKISPENL
jgi:hypothetical protein